MESPNAPPPPLSTVLPPLILGTATFNTQYHPDPTHMPYVSIVREALLTYGITAFDTSPYYGPSEHLLGNALETVETPRSSYLLLTKAGRINADNFDYSPVAIRASVYRSLHRLRTPYLDLVYAHDAEFVTPQDVLAAVQELRRLRDEDGIVRYVGISGYPVDVLASLAEMIYRETGEALDAVQSYSNFCVQNTRLGDPKLLQRFSDAGVDVLTNASMLGMGLLTTRGVDRGPMASWHPAPPELRRLCQGLAPIADSEGEHLEEVAIRWSMDHWARIGASFGSTAISHKGESGFRGPDRMGISVMGVSSVAELDETYGIWRSVINEESDGREVHRRRKIAALVMDRMWPSLGDWKDYSWPSGRKEYYQKESHDKESHDRESRHRESHHRDSHHRDSQHGNSHHGESHHRESHHRDSQHGDSHHGDSHHEDSHVRVSYTRRSSGPGDNDDGSSYRGDHGVDGQDRQEERSPVKGVTSKL